MSGHSPIRNRYIAVSSGVYSALKAIADVEGHDCPDAVADLRLGLLLSQEADMLWLVNERKKRLDQLNKDYRQRIEGKNDELP